MAIVRAREKEQGGRKAGVFLLSADGGSAKHGTVGLSKICEEPDSGQEAERACTRSRMAIVRAREKEQGEASKDGGNLLGLLSVAGGGIRSKEQF